jgi:putative nucleotidyltransferase with HDIG domain
VDQVFYQKYCVQKKGYKVDIHSFSYIEFNVSAVDLVNQIDQFYIINNGVNTLEHVRLVARTNIKIAEQYKLDINKCFLAGLLHDIGKPQTKTIDPENGHVHFYEHHEISAQIAKDILTRLRYSNDIIDEVVYLVQNHMELMNAPFNSKKARMIKRDKPDLSMRPIRDLPKIKF